MSQDKDLDLVCQKSEEWRFFPVAWGFSVVCPACPCALVLFRPPQVPELELDGAKRSHR